MKKLVLLCSFFAIHSLLFSQDNPLINTPSLSPDGKTMAFNFQGDLWLSTADGKNVTRLTIHEAYDTNPVWNANGDMIAFESNRYGNNDIFTIPVTGGIPTRITYHSANDHVTDFVNNEIIFTTARNYVQIEREAEIHKISANGGTPIRMMDALGFDAKMSPNNKFVVFTKGTCRIEREAYQGPANRDIWLYNIAAKTYTQLTDFQGQDYNPQWGDDATIYFLSARSGKYNIHKITIDSNGAKTGDITQLTNHTAMGLYDFSVSKNGSDIVLTSADKIWHYNTITKTETAINIVINADYRFDPVVAKTFTNNASEIAVSPNGTYTAFVVRGEVFLTENDKEKNKTVNLSNSPYRDQSISWLNDDTLLFISDRDGVNNLYKVVSSDTANKNLFTSLKHSVKKITNSKEGVLAAVVSPDKKQLAYVEGAGKLYTASIDEEGKISNKKTLLDGWDTPSNISWSPDSVWLTYDISDLYFNSEIFIHKADNSVKPVNISMHPKSDFGAIWSEDGSKIGFSSNRNNGDHDVWFVWLTKEDYDKTKQDWEEDEPEKKEDKKKETKEVTPVNIDFENIYERQQQVTSYTGGEYLRGISKDGKTFYFTTGNSGRGNPEVTADLYEIQWDGKDKKELTKGNSRPGNVTLNDKGDYIYYTSRGRISRIKLAGAKSESIPFSAKMKINYPEEANQIFEEAWKAINDRFYDPNHHGQNWDNLKDTYKPIAIKASTRDDFKMIFNKMLGQINASHMGMYRGEERSSVQSETTGVLGVELSATKKGALQVTYVVPESAADRAFSKINVGDIITSVNGNPVSVSENIYQYLNGTANEKIIVGITTSAGNDKEVVIRPKSNGRTDNYNAWVKERKRLTDEYSNGKLGYIHIQGMNWPSFERFERELTSAGNGKEGVVIDVRFNGGGWTTDYLMAVLNVKQHAYTIPRGAADDLAKEHTNFTQYYPFSERLPLAAWTKPSVALCNQSSYSNAEIFSHAYKELNLGKLVGMPTFGAVISTGGQTLIDGSYVRIPFRGWYVKSSQKNMDFTPAMPDIVLENAPDERAKGTDSQLKKAVDELLQELN